MKESDIVRLKRDFQGLKVGTEGTIVLEYDGSAFEVEFFDKNGDTIAVVMTPSDAIEAVFES